MLINVTIKNVGKETKLLDGSLFKLTDEAETEYQSSNNGTTAAAMSGMKTLFLKQCNPNIQTSGVLIFEVPEQKVYDLHMSGGYWSGKTAIVKLTKK